MQEHEDNLSKVCKHYGVTERMFRKLALIHFLQELKELPSFTIGKDGVIIEHGKKAWPAPRSLWKRMHWKSGN